MAFTQAHINALKAAIATGARRVRYPDGKEVEYRTLDEMQKTLLLMTNEVSPSTAPARTTYATISRD